MRALIPVLLVPVLSCTGGKDPDAGELTWYGDVQPVAYRVCGSCHNGEGVGPGDFTDFDTVFASTFDIKLRLERGEMPPPVSDPDCHEYEGSDHLFLTDEERQLFIDWIDAGADPGDPADSIGDYEPVPAHITDANVTLQIPEPFTITPDALGNQYRCFVLDQQFTQSQWISAFELVPDNVGVVHHAILFNDHGGDPGEDYNALGETSFDCMDPVLERDWDFLHGWAPGGIPTDFGDGLGLKVEAGDRLVLQMHYYTDPDGPPQTDQSAYKVRMSSTPVAEMYLVPGGVFDLRIPAGAAEHSESDAIDIDFPVTVAVHGVFPHMHRLGTHYRSRIDHADGTSTCILDGQFDFDHQTLYRFTDPIVLAQGDSVWAECTWDNSADSPWQQFDPPQDIYWGEGTQEEMCLFLTYVSIVGF